MKTNQILKGLGILLLLGLLITLIVFFIKSPSSNYEKIKNMFNNTNNNVPVGGILIHMMEPEDFENIVKNDSMELSLMADCASVHRHTCSAWTYMRKDLPPIVFIYPSSEIPTCGIIIDPTKAWSLLTTMGIIDSATNFRSCLSNEKSMNAILGIGGDNSCISQLLQRKDGGKYTGYTAYVPSEDLGGSCPLQCADDDNFCKYANAGGGINYKNLVQLPQCFNGNYDDCFNFTEVDKSKVPADVLAVSPNAPGYVTQTLTSNCTQPSKPFLCVTKNPPTDESKTKAIEEEKQFSAYINPDGSNWTNIFMPPNDTVNEFNNVNIMLTQCKFEKDNWNEWINVLKNYYSKTLSGLNPDNSYKDVNNNWQIANPDAPWTYLENEVNMYINPDKTTDQYKKQNQLFIDSIVGFFYVDTLCEDQLKSLNGIKTQYSSSSKLYSGVVDRCDGFYSMPPGDRPKVENEKRERSKNSVINIVNWFNKKYNKNTVGFSAKPDSNSFVNYDSWNKALTGQGNTSFDDIFSKIV